MYHELRTTLHSSLYSAPRKLSIFFDEPIVSDRRNVRGSKLLSASLFSKLWIRRSDRYPSLLSVAVCVQINTRIDTERGSRCTMTLVFDFNERDDRERIRRRPFPTVRIDSAAVCTYVCILNSRCYRAKHRNRVSRKARTVPRCSTCLYHFVFLTSSYLSWLKTA